MRVGVAYVDVRVNMTQYRKDLQNIKDMATRTTSSVNASFSKMSAGYSKMGKAAKTAAATRDVKGYG